ncbi:CHAT domain-containing protein [Microseira wollei]|nr:CHAT domain-containing protein [Microseira wollei]
MQIEQIIEICNKNNLTIVEYSIIYDEFIIQGRKQTKESNLLIWVVKPQKQIKFHKISLESLHISNISLAKLIIEARRSLGVEETETKASESARSNSLIDKNKKNKELQQLYQILIQPITKYLPPDPNSTVVFIPQESLFLTPFPALQDHECKFLIEKHTIITAPSIQVLELTQKRNTKEQETSLEGLVVGNPKMPTIPLTEPPVQLQDLAWAKTEANAIAPLLNTQAITGADATKAYITQLLPKARLIHIATHGLLDDIRQLGIPGAIALAPSDEDNGFLTAGEIYDMKLNAELVVLSACSTGQGKITGDGVVGLSRCLIAAGVKSVIVSLWSVGDLSTALLMVKFYQIFQQGVAAAIALNEAQRWLLGINKTELAAWVKTNERFFDATLKMNLRHRLHQLDDNAKPFENPRHWAAFCAIGQ